MLTLDPKTTALVLIDLQKGILPNAKAPYAGAQVLANAVALASRFRALGAPVVRVRVGFSPDMRERLATPTDVPFPVPPGGMPPGYTADPDELPPQPGDIDILKRQWNAFYGTELDLQLRRRGIRTIVLGGLVTSFGVDSTARAGWERNYEMVFPEDLSSAAEEVLHTYPMQKVFPRLGRVVTCADVLQALAGA
jgi:nicotinamidase-related amidase